MRKSQKNTICIIPARKNSKRVINKNLLKINGKTLVDICIELSKKSNLFKDIVLTSDSKKILSIGKKHKVYLINRSKNISKDNTSTDEVIKHVISKYNSNFDNIVILQVTSPLRKIKTLKKFYNYCIKRNLSSCLSVSLFNDNISLKKKFFSPLKGNKRRSQLRRSYIYENGLFYFVKKKQFIKTKKIYPKNNWNYFVTDKYESLDINEYNDYLIAKKISNK